MRVCLHMIVKDEAPVIERCLRSVLPHVDAVAIVDTGSSDDTPAICERVLAASGKPYTVKRSEWRGFAGSRNEALQLARELARGDDWLLFTLDADETLELTAPWPSEAGVDGWHVWVDLGGVRFTRTLLTLASTPWRYEGVVHEDVVLDRDYLVRPPIDGLLVRSTRDGARAKDPQRYARDAAALQEDFARIVSEIAQRPDDTRLQAERARTAFYIGNSLRDSGEHEQALAWYEQRMRMPGNEQENWACLHERARAMVLCGRDPRDVIEAHLIAYGQRPQRAETLRQLAEYLRGVGGTAAAQLFDDAAARMPLPAGDHMFVDRRAYVAQPRVAIVTAPRPGGQQLAHTLTACLASDELAPSSLRVFNDAAHAVPLPPWIAQESAPAEALAQRERGGVYGTLALARALRWAAGAEHVACVLEDDVLFARGWLRRAVALLDAAERVSDAPVVLSLHHMHADIDVLQDTGVSVGSDTLRRAGPRAFANGSQGTLCRPATALLLAAELEEHAHAAELDDRKAWAMDLGIWRCCHTLRIAHLLYTHPCLLWHQDSAPSTWATRDERWLDDDAAHRAVRRTRYFKPW